MKPKVLATSWHPGSSNAIVPVIKRLNAEGKTDVVTIGHQYSEKILDSHNIPFKTINDYELRDVSVKSMEQLLYKKSPNLVLTGTSAQDKNNRDVIEQTIILAARKAKIPSLAILDFWVDYSSLFSDIYTGESFRFLPDRIAILDKLAEEAMLREGFPRERLVITGNPYFDELVNMRDRFSEKDKRKVREDLSIDLESYLLLYASQPLEYHYGNKLGYTEKTALRELLDAVSLLLGKRNVNVLVKVHPREHKKDLEKITQGYNLPVVLNQSYPIRPAILASDAIISPLSTVLVESTYLDKPSISLQPGLKGDDLLITNQLGVTVPVYEHGKIGNILQRLLFDENYATELSQRGKRKGFSIDGKATERVTNLIYETLGLNS